MTHFAQYATTSPHALQTIRKLAMVYVLMDRPRICQELKKGAKMVADKKLVFVSVCGLAALVIILNCSQKIIGSNMNVRLPLALRQTTDVTTTMMNSQRENETASDSNDYNDQTHLHALPSHEEITTKEWYTELRIYKEQTDIRLPVHTMTLPYEEIKTKEWYTELRNFLSAAVRNDPVVLLTCSNQIFLPILMNWLTAYRLATGSNLSEILVVSTDDLTTHRSIIDKGLNSIFINDDVDIFMIKPVRVIKSVWMKRITVARIINHLGYDVLIIDLDAIYLKDFTTIIRKYNTSDIVGSMSKMPRTLFDLWGFTICMGVAYFRSSPGTGE